MQLRIIRNNKPEEIGCQAKFALFFEVPVCQGIENNVFFRVFVGGLSMPL